MILAVIDALCSCSNENDDNILSTILESSTIVLNLLIVELKIKIAH